MRLESSSCTSGGIRRIVGCGLDADSHQGTIQGQAVRRRPRQPPVRDVVPEEHERAGAQHRSAQEEGSGKGTKTPPPASPREILPRQQKGNSARRRRTSRPQMPEPSESMHGDGSSKSFPMHPIVQSLEASWGSFGRFLKLIKSKSFHDRKVGPRHRHHHKRGFFVSVSTGNTTAFG